MLHPTVRALSPGTIALGILLLAPTTAVAEVSDKEPSLVLVWAIGAGAAMVCFIGAHFRKWLPLVLAVPPLFWFASLIAELHSPDVGPHLYAEQGLSYYVQSYLSLALLISGVVLGWLRNRRRRGL